MDESPIACLPLEIRREVYRWVLLYEHAILVSIADQVEDTTFELRNYRKDDFHAKFLPRHFLALAHTCQQIRQESIQMFYGDNQFFIVLLTRIARGHVKHEQTGVSGAQQFRKLIQNTRGFVESRSYLPTDITIPINVQFDHEFASTRYYQESERNVELARLLLSYLDQLRRSNPRVIINFSLKLHGPDQINYRPPKELLSVCAKLDDNFGELQRALRSRTQAADARVALGGWACQEFFTWCEQLGLQHVFQPDVQVQYLFWV